MKRGNALKRMIRRIEAGIPCDETRENYSKAVNIIAKRKEKKAKKLQAAQ